MRRLHLGLFVELLNCGCCIYGFTWSLYARQASRLLYITGSSHFFGKNKMII